LKSNQSQVDQRNNIGKKVVTLRWLTVLTHIPIRKRLLLIFLLVSIIPIFLMGFLSYKISVNAISKKTTHYSVAGLMQTAQNLELVLKKYQNFTVQLGTTQEFTQYLEKINQPGTYATHLEEIQKLSNVFQSAFSLEKTFLGMAYYPADNDQIIVNAGSDDDATIKSFQKTSQYQTIIKNRAKAWLFYNQKFFLLTPVHNTFNGSFLGVCVIFINQAGLNKLLNFTLYKDAGFSEDELLKLPYRIGISKQGEIVASPFRKEVGEKLGDLVDDTGVMEAIVNSENDQVELMIKIGGRKMRVTFNPVNDGDLYILEMAPYSFLFAETAALGWWGLLIGIVISIVVFFVSWFFALGISKPLTKVMQAMKQAEGGNLSVAVDIATKDELGQLGKSFNLMLGNIKTLITNTKETVGEVLTHSKILEENSGHSAQSATAISLAIQEISKGTGEQTTEAEMTARKMGDLAQQIEIVVDKSFEMRQISEETKKLSLESQTVIRQLSDKANDTKVITTAFVNALHELNNSAGEIRGFTEIITNIAEQTTLLALNAAIEAARAGKYGSGFAVVAEEVNKLAVQSQTAGQMIEEILEKIQKKTQISNQTAAQANNVVAEQLIAVQKARHSYDLITDAMDTIVLRLANVHEFIEKMNVVKDVTLVSVSSIGAVSEENAAASQEVAAEVEAQTAIAKQVSQLAKELSRLAGKLTSGIMMFKD
jgi:methyl-accepting chemotaxis protein